jgi:prepilin-type N-terminal cleavage/methylation domain-containing protein
MKIVKRRSLGASLLAFTLIELLVVISIMAVLAGFTIPVMKSLKRQQVLKVARAEMVVIESALDNYKARYGTYPPGNRLAGGPAYAPSQFNQLFYELSGTTRNGGNFVTLDGSAAIPAASVSTAFGVGGFINYTKGNEEDAEKAKNFLPGLKTGHFNEYVTNNGVRTTALVTSVGGPDVNYRPYGPNAEGINPFRYVSPGVNNPGSYDLWVQLVIAGKTNLVCNWSKAVIRDSPLP